MGTGVWWVNIKTGKGSKSNCCRIVLFKEMTVDKIAFCIVYRLHNEASSSNDWLEVRITSFNSP
jgi:hypothetical protein